MTQSILLNKIINNQVKIGIVGLGYVGLPLFLNFLKSNFFVVGFDKNKKYLNNIRKNKNIIGKLDTSILKKKKSKYFFTNKVSHLKKCDVIIVCLPTPIYKNNTPDLRIINNFFFSLKKVFKENQLLVIESTIYPGVIEKYLLTKINKDLKIGKNFFIGFSPEREDPGNKNFNLYNIPKVCSGQTKSCLKLTISLYKKIVKKVVVEKNIETAQVSKLFENIYRNVNIALVNELKLICKNANISVNDVLKLASTKPFGFKKFDPGPGVGGHCIPIDPFYFSYFAKTKGMASKFVYLSAKINKSVPKWIVNEINLFVKKKKLKLKKILIIGISYKKNTEDLRESPSLIIMNLLKEVFNCKIDYYDPFVRKLPITRINKIKINSVNLKKIKLNKYDLVIISTDHDKIDYKKILTQSKLIVDLRNKYKNFNLKKIIKL
tara:strand:+ start:2765 stop:4066 length:1302 start_codon:yes stop_codon:yes gene_type:complete